MDTEYSIAYKEVLEILNYVSIEDYNKIPKEKIDLFKEYADKDYVFNYNPNKTLNEQNVSKIAKGIIAILFRDYWATPYQKEKILKKEKFDRQNIEDDKRIKYNSTDIFEKRNVKNEKIYKEHNLPIKTKRERFYQKIINFFKKYFTR